MDGPGRTSLVLEPDGAEIALCSHRAAPRPQRLGEVPVRGPTGSNQARADSCVVKAIHSGLTARHSGWEHNTDAPEGLERARRKERASAEGHIDRVAGCALVACVRLSRGNLVHEALADLQQSRLGFLVTHDAQRAAQSSQTGATRPRGILSPLYVGTALRPRQSVSPSQPCCRR